MTLQTLKSDNTYDRVLKKYLERKIKYIEYIGALINNGVPTRGDMVEISVTCEPTKRDGLPGVSRGDFFVNGRAYEIKYVTKQTPASLALQGTTCEYHLIALNNGKTIKFYKIASKDIEAIGDEVIKDGKPKKVLKYKNVAKYLGLEK